jgi:hypothetical protein
MKIIVEERIVERHICFVSMTLLYVHIFLVSCADTSVEFQTTDSLDASGQGFCCKVETSGNIRRLELIIYQKSLTNIKQHLLLSHKIIQ